MILKPIHFKTRMRAVDCSFAIITIDLIRFSEGRGSFEKISRTGSVIASCAHLIILKLCDVLIFC
jgi:hypothetical protein